MTTLLLATLLIANLALTAHLARRRFPVGSFRTLSLGPEDLLVIQTDRQLSQQMIATLKEQWAALTGTATNVVILPPELNLGVIHGGLRNTEAA